MLAMTFAYHQREAQNVAGDQWQWLGAEGVKEGGSREVRSQGT